MGVAHYRHPKNLCRRADCVWPPCRVTPMSLGTAVGADGLSRKRLDSELREHCPPPVLLPGAQRGGCPRGPQPVSRTRPRVSGTRPQPLGWPHHGHLSSAHLPRAAWPSLCFRAVPSLVGCLGVTSWLFRNTDSRAAFQLLVVNHCFHPFTALRILHRQQNGSGGHHR